jgi:hypothetical protein
LDLSYLESDTIADGSRDQKADLRTGVLVSIIQEKRNKLQNDAIPKGEMLYRDSPKQFVRRLDAYWHNWSKALEEQIPSN